MFKEIKIGEKTVSLQANGATPLWFKQLFHKDIIAVLNGADDVEKVSDCAPELAYVMAKQAEKADMTKTSREDFVAWLEQFEPLDILMASSDIITVYMGTKITSAESKKKVNGRQSAR